MSEVDQNETATTAAATTATPALVNPVTMVDGTVVDFGKRGQLLRDITITEGSGFSIGLKLITGTFQSVALDRASPIYDMLAARGAAEFISNSVSGVYKDKDGLHPEDFELGIEKAISALEAGKLAEQRASEDLKGQGDLIRALQELRKAATAEDGTPTFSDADTSWEACKAVILGSDESTNKARKANPAYSKLLARYAVERAQAREAKIVEASADLALL